ncbi:MAG: hypothetical protein BRC31_01935 [Actinobacteria bacterium QS_5_72_10]|nr:MAG: hypothetical protein BRC31_01935 [Actinobacteria bacterium QS_5_72_10]
MPTHPIACDSLHRRLLTAGAVLAVALATVATPVGAAARAPEQPGASTTTPLIVTLDDSATASVASLVETLGARVEGLAAKATPLPRSNAMSVTVPSSNVAAARQRLAQHPEVASVERDATVQAHTTPVSVTATPNDPRYPQQWALPHINAPEAWSQTTGSSSVRVAVLDTGVDASHTDLANNIGRSYNAVGSGDATTDSYGHGTKAAGVAAAVTNNLTAVAGVCWNCEIWPVKVMADDGSGLHSDVAEGVRWAADAGADVIALSLGGHGRTSTLERAISDAVDSGAVVVASAGNYGTSEPVFPAAYDDAMGVAALDRDDQRTSYSSYGDWVSIGAPGCTLTTESDGGTVKFCGTSAAAPHVAGLVGLATAHGATPQGARSAIREGAHPTGQGMGHGRIDAEATLELVDQADEGSTGDGSTNDGSSATAQAATAQAATAAPAMAAPATATRAATTSPRCSVSSGRPATPRRRSSPRRTSRSAPNASISPRGRATPTRWPPARPLAAATARCCWPRATCCRRPPPPSWRASRPRRWSSSAASRCSARPSPRPPVTRRRRR